MPEVFGFLFGLLALTNGLGYYVGGGNNGIGGSQMGGGQPSAPQPYNFNYQAGGMDGSQYRNEQADASGNVQGTYGYTDSQGLYRKVMYTAGPQGFKATVDTNEPGTASQPENPADVNMMAQQSPAGIQAKYSGANNMGSGGFGAAGASAGFYSAGQNGAGHSAGMDMGAPQPYSFNYQAGDQYRNEQADASGNVQGSYGYTDNQGLYRKVMYSAGPEGFKATVNTNEPGTDSKPENPADVNMLAQQPPAGIQSKYSGSSSLNGGHAGSGGAGLGFYSGGQIGGGLSGGMGMEKPEPYSFNYQAGDQYRNEQADASGNVQGSYGYTDSQGLFRKVMYSAGPEGFKATVNTNEPGTDSKPENPADVNMNAQQPPAGIQNKYSSASGVISGHGSFGGANAGFYSAGQNGAGQAGGMQMAAPQPYNFNYQTGNQFRNEQADASGNVKGTYGYTDSQGLYRKVMYSAGPEGFKATVDTNEPGTDSKPENPANVNMMAKQSPAGIQAKYSSQSIGVNSGSANPFAGIPLSGRPKSIH